MVTTQHRIGWRILIFASLSTGFPLWQGDNERLCAVERRLRRFLTPEGKSIHFFSAVLTKDINLCDLLFAFLNEKIFKLGFLLTLKAPNKICSRRHFNFLLLSFKENKA